MRVLESPGGSAEGEECGTAEAAEDAGGGDPEAETLGGRGEQEAARPSEGALGRCWLFFVGPNPRSTVKQASKDNETTKKNHQTTFFVEHHQKHTERPMFQTQNSTDPKRSIALPRETPGTARGE